MTNLVEFKINSDNKTVTALFIVAQADVRREDGKVFEWQSLKNAALDDCLQTNVKIGSIFLHDGHASKVYDENRKPVALHPHEKNKVAKLLSLFPHEEDKSIRAWVEFCENDHGIRESTLIRNGKIPKISMVDFEETIGNKAYTRQIIGADIVSVPNVPTARMLTYHSWEEFTKEENNNMSILKAFLNKHGLQNDKLIKLATDRESLITNGIMSLEEILGQASTGWLTSDAVAALRIHIECYNQLKEAADANSEEMAVNGDVFNSMAIQLATVKKAVDEKVALMSNSLSTITNVSTKNDTVLFDQMTNLNNVVNKLTQSVAQLVENKKTEPIVSVKEDKKEQKEDTFAANEFIKNIFVENSDVIKIDEKEYSIKELNETEINALKFLAHSAPDKATATISITQELDKLNKIKLETNAKKIGLNLQDEENIEGKGKSSMENNTNLQANTYTKDLSKKVDQVMQRNFPDALTHKRSLGTHAKEIIERFQTFYDNGVKQQTENIEKALSSNVLQAHQAQEWKDIGDFLNQFPRAHSSAELTANDFNQAATTPSNAIIMPAIKALWLMEQLETLTALDLVSGITPDMTTSGSAGTNVNIFGRVGNFGHLFINEVSSENKESDHVSEVDDVTVLDEITIKTARQQYNMKDYQLVIRFLEGHMQALMSSGAPMDLVATLSTIARERLNRQRDKRIYRHLFRQASIFNFKHHSLQAVANIAPSGSGKLVKGEFVFIADDTSGITIGNKTFKTANDGSNIRWVIRILGSNTTNTAFFNVPIVEEDTVFTVDENGQFTKSIENEVVVKAGANTLVKGFKVETLNPDGSIKLSIGGTVSGAGYYVDNDGFIVGVGGGVTSDPTSPALAVTYDEVTNYETFNVNNGATPAREYYSLFYKQTGQIAANMNAYPNFASPDVVVMDQRIGQLIRDVDLFDSQTSPAGTSLSSVYSSDMLISQYGGLTYLGVNSRLPYGTGRALMMKRGHTGVMFNVREMSNLYRGMKADTVTGKIKVTNELVADIMEQMVIGTPRLINPSTGRHINCPYKLIIFYGTIPSFGG